MLADTLLITSNARSTLWGHIMKFFIIQIARRMSVLLMVALLPEGELEEFKIFGFHVLRDWLIDAPANAGYLLR